MGSSEHGQGLLLALSMCSFARNASRASGVPREMAQHSWGQPSPQPDGTAPDAGRAIPCVRGIGFRPAEGMRVAVTGAYGYSGQYIAQRLLDAGHEVHTLTNSPHRANPFGDASRRLATISPSQPSSKSRCAASTSSSTITGYGSTSHYNYYNETRTHLSLNKDAPLVRAIQRHGAVVAVPILSGLHHCYARI